MKYYIKQIGKKDCGITALKILLANVYHKKDFLFYPQNSKNKSLSLQEIIDIGRNEGVFLEAYRLVKKNEILKLKGKDILIVIKKNNMTHLCYVDKIKSKSIIIFDTSKGKIKYNYHDFFSLWTGEVLERTRVIGSTFKINNKNIIPKYQLFLLNLIHSITVVTFLIGLFFINKNYDFLLSTILFSSFAILFILNQQLIIYYMKKTDKKLFFDVINNKEENFKEKYKSITNLKKYLFGNNINFINSIILSIFSIESPSYILK